MSFLSGKRELLKSSLVLDDPDAKIIETKCLGGPFFFTLGKPKRTSKPSDLHAQAKMNDENRKELTWDLLFTPSNIPGFMRIEQFKMLAELVVSLSVGTKLERGSQHFHSDNEFRRS